MRAFSRSEDPLAELRRQKRGLETALGTVLLLDVSQSMNERVGGARKIDLLRRAVGAFPALRRWSFSEQVYPGQIPEPQTGTNLARALCTLTEEAPARVILVSDGEPNDEEEALASATRLGRPVDVIYIGEPETSGERFMRRLAEATGGRWVTVAQAELADGIGREIARLALPGRCEAR